jgi:hypothetical protein
MGQFSPISLDERAEEGSLFIWRVSLQIDRSTLLPL